VAELERKLARAKQMRGEDLQNQIEARDRRLELEQENQILTEVVARLKKRIESLTAQLESHQEESSTKLRFAMMQTTRLITAIEDLCGPTTGGLEAWANDVVSALGPSPSTDGGLYRRVEACVDSLAREVRKRARMEEAKAAADAQYEDLRGVVNDMQNKVPMVVLEQKKRDTVEWRIADVLEIKSQHLKGSCVYSPPLGRDIYPVEFEFYPNGSADAPPRRCSLGVRCPKGTRVTCTLFLGGQRTEPVEILFEGRNGAPFLRHFGDLHSEIMHNGALLVGLDVIHNHRTAKYLVY